MIHAFVDGSYFPERHIGIACYKIEGQQPVHQCINLPLGTNNQMEYLAVLNLLSSLKDFASVEVNSDSALVVHQLNDEWRIQNRELKALHDEIKCIIDKKHLTAIIIWLPRERNEAGIFLEKKARILINNMNPFSANKKPLLAKQKAFTEKL